MTNVMVFLSANASVQRLRRPRDPLLYWLGADRPIPDGFEVAKKRETAPRDTGGEDADKSISERAEMRWRELMGSKRFESFNVRSGLPRMKIPEPPCSVAGNAGALCAI